MGARRMRGPAQDIGNNTQALRDFRNYAVTAHAALARTLRSARCVLTPQSEDDE